MKIFVVNEEGDMEEMDPNKKGANELMKFLRTLQSGSDEEGEVKTPRGTDHGWWNCEGCREIQHDNNLERVQDGLFTDEGGNYFTLEYLKDMAKYYALETNNCVEIMAHIDKWNKAVEEGLDIPESKFY